MTGSAPALAIEGLTKRFGRTRALDGVDLTVSDSAFVVVLGAAGAGKTTLLRAVAGLDVPDAGSITIAGRDVTGLEPRHRDIAMIFDNLALYPDRTGFENLAHPLQVRRLPAPAIDAKVREVAATLRISHILGRLPKTMSGGERQRVALGRALVRDPRLFLLDEPLSSLDAMLRIELRAELKRLQREHGYAFLLATPDYAEALAVADTIVMLVKGQVRQVAAPQDLYDRPVDRDVARFVGAPEINLLPADYDPSEGGLIRLADAVFPAPDGVRAAFAREPRAFEAGLRPEHIQVLRGEGGTSSPTLPATVVDVEPLGLQSALTLGVSGGQSVRITAPAAGVRDLSAGDAVRLAPRLDRLIAFDGADGRLVA